MRHEGQFNNLPFQGEVKVQKSLFSDSNKSANTRSEGTGNDHFGEDNFGNIPSNIFYKNRENVSANNLPQET